MREYKEHFVAFIDILGFKEIITNEECDNIYNIFAEIHSRSNTELNFNGFQIEAFDHVHHRILSDSVVLFIDAEIPDSFATIVTICRRLQSYLANRDNPILLRGGIVKGLLYYEDDIIYGQGLTDAYLLESKLAKHPRVIFTGDTLRCGKENTKYMFPDLEPSFNTYRCDEDGLYFANYLTPLIKLGPQKVKVFFDRLLNLCETMLNRPIDNTLREKYLWLKRKIMEEISHMPQIKEIYKNEAEAKAQLEHEAYNARFSIYNDNKGTRNLPKCEKI